MMQIKAKTVSRKIIKKAIHLNTFLFLIIKIMARTKAANPEKHISSRKTTIPAGQLKILKRIN